MRVYTVQMAATAEASSPTTLIQVKPGISSIVLLRAKVTQSSVTTSAMQDVAIGTSTGAATVTSYTPKPHDLDGAAAKAVGGTTATGVNASAEGSGPTDIKRDSLPAGSSSRPPRSASRSPVAGPLSFTCESRPPRAPPTTLS